MSDDSSNHRLATLMASAGYTSHKAFARAVRSVSAEAGRPVSCDHTSVSRWLRGMSPRPETAICITTVLSRALGRQVSLSEAGLAASAVLPVDLGLDYPTSTTDAIDALGLLWRADSDDAALVVNSKSSPSAWQSVALSWLLGEREDRSQSRPLGLGAGMTDVTRIGATTTLFAQLDNAFGGGHARHALIRYLEDEVEPLLRGRYSEVVGNALFSAAAQAMLLVAWMSYDSGRHGLAQRYFIQALSLADGGHDRLLGANVLDAMSHQATFLGRYGEAANLAAAAQAGARRTATPSLAAHFLVMEARALAGGGHGRGCHRALSDATSLFDRRDPSADPDWFRYFDEAELEAEFAHCLRDLGQFPLSADHAQLCESSSCGPRSDFFATMVLADAHLGSGAVEQACQTALNALLLAEQIQSARCASYLQKFQSRLAGVSGAGPVREFLEQAEGFALWQTARSGGLLMV